MTDNGPNFLSANISELEYLQDDDVVYGYDYNRIIDALNGNRDGLITINSDNSSVVVSPSGIAGTNPAGGTTFQVSASGVTTVAHNDTFVNTENVDPNFPGRLNYIIPGNALKVIEARLSFKLLTYRTYNSLALTATGAGSSHSHSVGAESAAHNHSLFINISDGTATPLGIDANTTPVAVTGAGVAKRVTFTDDTGDTGHDHGTSGSENAHTHTVSGTSTLGITEGAIASNITLQFDGTDYTATLHGPWNTDVVEMDVLSILPKAIGSWHTINFSTATLGQIQSHLRLTVLVQANP